MTLSWQYRHRHLHPYHQNHAPPLQDNSLGPCPSCRPSFSGHAFVSDASSLSYSSSSCRHHLHHQCHRRQHRLRHRGRRRSLCITHCRHQCLHHLRYPHRRHGIFIVISIIVIVIHIRAKPSLSSSFIVIIILIILFSGPRPSSRSSPSGQASVIGILFCGPRPSCRPYRRAKPLSSSSSSASSHHSVPDVRNKWQEPRCEHLIPSVAILAQTLAFESRASQSFSIFVLFPYGWMRTRKHF